MAEETEKSLSQKFADEVVTAHAENMRSQTAMHEQDAAFTIDPSISPAEQSATAAAMPHDNTDHLINPTPDDIEAAQSDEADQTDRNSYEQSHFAANLKNDRLLGAENVSSTVHAGADKNKENAKRDKERKELQQLGMKTVQDTYQKMYDNVSTLLDKRAEEYELQIEELSESVEKRKQVYEQEKVVLEEKRQTWEETKEQVKIQESVTGVKKQEYEDAVEKEKEKTQEVETAKEQVEKAETAVEGAEQDVQDKSYDKKAFIVDAPQLVDIPGKGTEIFTGTGSDADTGGTCGNIELEGQSIDGVQNPNNGEISTENGAFSSSSVVYDEKNNHAVAVCNKTGKTRPLTEEELNKIHAVESDITNLPKLEGTVEVTKDNITSSENLVKAEDHLKQAQEFLDKKLQELSDQEKNTQEKKSEYDTELAKLKELKQQEEFDREAYQKQKQITEEAKEAWDNEEAKLNNVKESYEKEIEFRKRMESGEFENNPQGMLDAMPDAIREEYVKEYSPEIENTMLAKNPTAAEAPSDISASNAIAPEGNIETNVNVTADFTAAAGPMPLKPEVVGPHLPESDPALQQQTPKPDTVAPA